MRSARQRYKEHVSLLHKEIYDLKTRYEAVAADFREAHKASSAIANMMTVLIDIDQEIKSGETTLESVAIRVEMLVKHAVPEGQRGLWKMNSDRILKALRGSRQLSDAAVNGLSPQEQIGLAIGIMQHLTPLVGRKDRP